MGPTHKELKNKIKIKCKAKLMKQKEDGREGVKKEIDLCYFSLYSFFSESRVSNRQNSSG